MSLVIDDSSRTDPAATPETSGRGPGGPGMWIRIGLALALIAGSAGLRLWQQGRFDDILRSGQLSPFPLADIPLELGDWTGVDDTLDPKIAAATGAIDAIFRTYTNELTGTRVSLILLYGPSIEVTLHTPEACYTASGYATLSGPDVRNVALDDTKVPFYAHTFARGEGGQRETQRVFCTWRFGNTWIAGKLKSKEYQRIPGLYKVHLARGALPGELFSERDDKGRETVVDPCEDLASLLLIELDGRLEASGAVPG